MICASLFLHFLMFSPLSTGNEPPNYRNSLIMQSDEIWVVRVTGCTWQKTPEKGNVPGVLSVKVVSALKSGKKPSEENKISIWKTSTPLLHGDWDSPWDLLLQKDPELVLFLTKNAPFNDHWKASVGNLKILYVEKHQERFLPDWELIGKCLKAPDEERVLLVFEILNSRKPYGEDFVKFAVDVVFSRKKFALDTRLELMKICADDKIPFEARMTLLQLLTKNRASEAPIEESQALARLYVKYLLEDKSRNLHGRDLTYDLYFLMRDQESAQKLEIEKPERASLISIIETGIKTTDFSETEAKALLAFLEKMK